MPKYDETLPFRSALDARDAQKHPRYEARANVEVLLEESARIITLPLVNISLGGLFLQSSEPAPPGSRLRLRLRTREHAIGAAARVVHVIDVASSQEKRHPPGMGLEFERLTSDARSALERFVGGLSDVARAGREARAVLSGASVVVRTHTLAELQALWGQDLSKGGLFVATPSPPPLGTRLPVELHTPGGSLSLTAEVVHVLDAETARLALHPAGAGLQLLDLAGDKRQALESYALGHTARLGAQVTARAAGTASMPSVLEAVRALFHGVEKGDCHLALGLGAEASEAEERARVTELRALLSSPPLEATPPQLARIHAARRVLLRVEQHLEAWRRAGQGELTRLPEGRDPEVARELQRLLRAAADEVRRGDLFEARRTLVAARELAPGDADIEGRLAAVVAGIQRRRALDLLEPAATFVVAGMKKQALEHARGALALSDAKDVRVAALRVLYQAGASDEALDLARALSELDPSLPVPLEVRLRVHEQREEHADALAAAEALFALRPDDGKLKVRVKKLRARVRRGR